MASLQAGSVIDDLTSELIPDNDEGVLWGSPINTWAGDMQPLEVVHGIPAHVPKWGAGFKTWLKKNYLHLFRLYSQHSSLSMRRFYCDLDPTIVDPHGEPTLRITHDCAEHDRKAVDYLAAAGGDPAALIEEHYDRVTFVHLKGWRRSPFAFTPIDRGDLDLRPTLAVLRERNFDGWIAVELG